METLAALVIGCLLPAAVYRLKRASTRVDVILQDVEGPAPSPAETVAPAPKETHTA